MIELDKNVFFQRKNFVKDLLNIQNIINKQKEIEFDSYIDFINLVITNKINIDNICKVIIPIESYEELNSLFRINHFKPILYIYIKNDIENIIKNIDKEYKIGIIIDDNNIDKFKNSVEKYQKISILRNCCGIVKVNIDPSKDLDSFNLLNKITEPFLTFPFFNNIWINWNLNLFNNLPINILKYLDYQLSLLKINVLNTDYEINGSKYGYNSSIKYKYDFYYSFYNKIHMNEDYMYIPTIESSKIYFNKDYDIDKMSTSEITKMREFYDYTSNDKSCITTYYDNKLCTGSALIPSYVYEFISSILGVK